MPHTIVDRVFANAESEPDKLFAIVLSGDRREELTYRSLVELSRRYATWYAARGVGRGDVVALMVGHSAAAFPAFVGAMLAGAVPSIFPAMSPKQDAALFWKTHRQVFDRISPAMILSDVLNAALLCEHIPERRDATSVFDDLPVAREPGISFPEIFRDDVALLQHSSGTTGLKKGVALSHRAIVAQVDDYAPAIGAVRGDVIASWLPLYHDMGLIACFMLPAILGMTTVYLSPFEWVSRPSSLLDAVQKYNATLAWMPNFAFQHIVRTAPKNGIWDLSSLRALINCSEPCKAATFEAFYSRFAESGLRREALQVCYAMAENVFAVTQTNLARAPRVVEDVDGKSARYLSCGEAIHGVTLRVLDGDQRQVDDGAVGEIHVGGRSLFSGYHLAETRSLRDGWYASGDLGFLYEGELFITGRVDDLLIIRGKNLYAHDIEQAVQSDALKAGRAVALGIYNERTASQDLVIVAEREGTDSSTDASVVRRVKESVYAETGATVSDVRIVEPGWLVKTTSGKISREANAKKYLEGFGRLSVHVPG